MTTAPLLLCYDGSPDAKLAIARAAATFEPRPAIVVSVWEAPAPGETKLVAFTRERAAETLAAEGVKLAEARGFASVRALAIRSTDSVWESILDVSAQFGTAVTVLGSRGRSGVRSALLGSVANHIVHHATSPTFVVQHDATESTAKSALIAYDGSDDAQQAIEWAGQVLARRPVTVLAVWQDPHAALSHAWAGMAYVTDLSEIAAAAEQAATTCAAEGAALATAAGLDAEPLVRQAAGPVWPTILEASEQLDASVVVLGSRGLTGISTLMLGSVSDAVLHHTRRPTFIVRRGTQLDRPATSDSVEREVLS